MSRKLDRLSVQTSAPGKPIVYANEDEKVLRILREQNCPDFTLVTVSGLDWDRELSPWKAPVIFFGDKDFKGNRRTL